MNLHSAVWEEMPIRVCYADGQGRKTRRILEPIRMYSGRNGHTYLRAYCRLREEERTFRLDRISSWRLAEEPVASSMAVAASSGPAAVSSMAAAISSVPSSAVPFPPVLSESRVSIAPSRKGSVRKLLSTACVCGFLWLLITGSLDDFVQGIADGGKRAAADPFSSGVGPVAAAVRFPGANPPPTVKPAPDPGSWSFVGNRAHRGIIIVEEKCGARRRFSAEGYETASDIRDIRLAINRSLFRKATGISDSRLTDLYAAADADGDASLSWEEIRAFQLNLQCRFRYEGNAVALRPDLFFAAGGGDCEDWALVSCALFRFWGYSAYVGCFEPEDSGSGHAVCLLQQAEKPGSLGCYRLEGRHREDGLALPTGYYIPIDYDRVGELSDAVGKGWELERIYRPEGIYGRLM